MGRKKVKLGKKNLVKAGQTQQKASRGRVKASKTQWNLIKLGKSWQNPVNTSKIQQQNYVESSKNQQNSMKRQKPDQPRKTR